MPTLSPVLQKGAHWRWTCFVLFDDPTEEDSGIPILSFARLPRNRVCVCVCVCVCVTGQAVCMCPPSDGGYNMVLNFEIFLCGTRDFAGRVHAGSGLGSSGDGAQRAVYFCFCACGVEMIGGPPHRMLLAGAVPAVLQKGA